MKIGYNVIISMSSPLRRLGEWLTTLSCPGDPGKMADVDSNGDKYDLIIM